jgi:hypothetical protein
VKTWSAFARNTLTWSIEQTDRVYQIVWYRKDAKRYWEADPDRKIVFPSGMETAAVIARMISVMAEAAAIAPQ